MLLDGENGCATERHQNRGNLVVQQAAFQLPLVVVSTASEVVLAFAVFVFPFFLH